MHNLNRVVIAANCYRERSSSIKICELISNAYLHNIDFNARLKCLPFSDGGDGSLEVLSTYLKLSYEKVETVNLFNETTTIDIGVYNDKAIIEIANIIGLKTCLGILKPMEFSSKGVGIVLRKLLDKGYRKFIFFLGGSAVIDAGLGMIQELGLSICDKAGNIRNFNMCDLKDAYEIKSNIDDRLLQSKLYIYTDVINRFVSNGGMEMFFSQKGVKSEDLDVVETALYNYHRLLLNFLNIDIDFIVGGGASGGLAATLAALSGILPKSGAVFFSKISKLEKHISNADITITGEGKLDEQTLNGKGPIKVAQLARRLKKPVIVVTGAYEYDKVISNYFDLIIWNENNVKYDTVETQIFDIVKRNKQEIIKLLSHEN